MAATSLAANAAQASFAALLTKLQYFDTDSIELVRQAYRWADELHLGQLRNSGEPYITHPIAVTALCADWKLDAQALCAALLHDALEDCGIAKADIVLRFGSTVADLVDGLTKLEKLPITSREENQAESFRKMLLAMATDIRVILIKLADRTHNMRTLGNAPSSKWGRIAGETQDIYAPIAHRLGLNQTYRELQDLSFKHLKPWRYITLTKATERARARARALLANGKRDLDVAFTKCNMPASVSGREKTLHSIYRKMRNKRINFADISDLYGFRIVVASLAECYTALGVLHQLYKPVPGRFKDHIAIPKVNGYQSLHTTVVGPSGVTVEFQIRTEPMHWIAESGVAAHWLYKAKTVNAVGAQWLQSLLDIQTETRDASEFWDHVRVDLFPDAVYVFTPKNRIMSLPRGATVVDFAYAVHSTIGDRCMAAKVNGELVPLRTELKNGDRIEVVTAPVSQPNPAWLLFVRTGRARSKIRHYLKTQAQSQSEAMGQRLLVQALRAEGFDALPAIDDSKTMAHSVWDKLLKFSSNKSPSDLLFDLGLGKRVATVIAKRMAKLLMEQGALPNPALLSGALLQAAEGIGQQSLVVDGDESASTMMASCCSPIPGDGILGYLGHGEGLVIHRSDCAVAQRLTRKDEDRMIDAHWADNIERTFAVAITVSVKDGQGVLAQVTSALAQADANIVHIEMGQEQAEQTTDLRFRIAIKDLPHLSQVLKSLARLPSVVKAVRG
jgi:GTP diphosphokinase / guanosine-3',5'-bis(diphosphate) 3'-diphosphatase